MTIPDEHIPLILEALQFRADYLKSQLRDERPCLEIVELLQRKPAGKEESPASSKKKRA